MLEFIAANLPILVCFIIGLVLVVVETFVPGFGLPGITGVILHVVAVAFTWFKHGPMAALGMTVLTVAIIAVAISISLRSAAKGRLSKSKLVLSQTESNEEGYRASEDLQVFLGKEGMTTTVLRPTGMAEFDQVKLNVVSDGEFIPVGTKVRITEVEGSRILVRTVD